MMRYIFILLMNQAIFTLYIPDTFSCQHVKISGIYVIRRNTYRICGSPLWRAARCSFACYRNRDEITILVCEQKPYPLWFSCRHKLKLSDIAWTPIQYVTESTFEIVQAQLNCCVTEIEPNSPFLCVNVQKPYPLWFSCRNKSYPL